MPKFSKQLLRRVFVRDRLVLTIGLSAFVFQAITWAMMLWKGLPFRGEELLPLHYTIYFGIDYVGPWYGVFGPSLFGLIAFFVNLIVVIMIYERNRFFAYTFVLGTAFIELIVLAGSFFILFLNQ